MIVDVFGFIGLFFLIFSFLQKDIIKLRTFNIIAALIYLIQAVLLSSWSLLFTDLLIIGLNGFMIIKKIKK